MARPREFEYEDALRGAMDVFWTQGYRATNLPDLLKAMGLTRGSFYQAFGDKEAAYLNALDYYDSDIIKEVDALGSPGSVLQHVLEVVVPVQEAHFSNSLE